MKQNSFLLIIILAFVIPGCNNKENTNSRTENTEANIGAVLLFPEPPSASTYGESIFESRHMRRQYPGHLTVDAPNIVIVLMADVGFGSASTFGGEINTSTLSRLYNEGIAYNQFHTTVICSPTRACQLTGRNHTRVGNGTIAERAVDWDGYTGIIPKEAATVAEVLKDYGYSTSAFGKWHNTPANQTSAAGPFDFWPVNYGFQHFYAFLGGETSQWEPVLINDFTPIQPPHSENYLLISDLADQAIKWMQNQKAFADAKAAPAPKVQFFDSNGSRGIYRDGWYACAFGPLFPWLPASPGLGKWRPENDVWELYNLNEDFTQNNNLAGSNPEKLKEMQKLFMTEAKENKDLPINAGIWLRLHPEDVITSPYKTWTFSQTSHRMPEFSAPGKHQVEIITNMEKPGAPATVTISVDGKQAVVCHVGRTVPAAFSATETFDVGIDMGSPVLLKYHNKAPFEYNGKINSLKVDLL